MAGDVTNTSSLLRNNMVSTQDTKRQNDTASARASSTTAASESPAPQTPDISNTNSFSAKAYGLTSRLDNIGQSIRAIQNAETGVRDISELLGQAEAVLQEVFSNLQKNGVDLPPSLESRFDEVRAQITDTAQNAAVNGTNLLTGDTLKTNFSDEGNATITTLGQDLRSEALGLNAADFTTRANVEARAEEVSAARSTTESFSESLMADRELIHNRELFTRETIETLATSKNENTEFSEEGANLLALQLRLSLSTSNESLASSEQQGVIRLF